VLAARLDFAGMAVLDLYAGSGALGLEAVSRGAASADLVEKSAKAAGVAQRNAARVAKAMGSDAVVRTHRVAADAFLAGHGGAPTWDLVFLDPPYDLGEAELAGTLDRLLPRLAAKAVVVIERGSRSPQPSLPDGLALTRSKKYGDTTLWWAEPA